MSINEEDKWALWLGFYTIVYLVYILLESRDDVVDVPVAVMATGFWLYGMLKTLYKEYQRSI